MKEIFSFALLQQLFVFTFCDEQSRHLVYPPGLGNKVQFIVGIGVPVSDLPALQSVTWGYVIKTNYAVPTNISQYGNLNSGRPRKRSTGITRWDIYRALANVINRTGLPGNECIKRSICEAAQINFTTRHVAGELLHILLLPSTSGDTETEYYEAEMIGMSLRSNCGDVYKKCPISFVDLISTVRHEPLTSRIYAM